jgi:hypothetical protein
LDWCQQARRVYCFRPKNCSCRVNNKVTRATGASSSPLVHLPVPYSCCPKSYFDRDDQGEEDISRMRENPFFHQILDESRCVGNMLLTPYGRHQAKQLLLQEETYSKRPKLESSQGTAAPRGESPFQL